MAIKKKAKVKRKPDNKAPRLAKHKGKRPESEIKKPLKKKTTSPGTKSGKDSTSKSSTTSPVKELPVSPVFMDEQETVSASAAGLADVTNLSHMILRKDQDITAMEMILKNMNEEFRRLSEEDLPSVMKELKLKTLTLENGAKVTLSDDVYCSLTEATKEQAFDWLTANKFDGIIKTEVGVMFGRDELEGAVKLIARLQKLKLEPIMTRGIHAQTLRAFLREQLALAAKIPLELFNARPVTIARVKPAKEA